MLKLLKVDNHLTPDEVREIAETVPLAGIGLSVDILRLGVSENALREALNGCIVMPQPIPGLDFAEIHDPKSFLNYLQIPVYLQDEVPGLSEAASENHPALAFCPYLRAPFSIEYYYAPHAIAAVKAYENGAMEGCQWPDNQRIRPALNPAIPTPPEQAMDYVFGEDFAMLGKALVDQIGADLPWPERALRINGLLAQCLPRSWPAIDVTTGFLVRRSEVTGMIADLMEALHDDRVCKEIERILPTAVAPKELADLPDLGDMVWSGHIDYALHAPELIR